MPMAPPGSRVTWRLVVVLIVLVLGGIVGGVMLVVAVRPAGSGGDATPAGTPTITTFESSPDPIELEPIRPGANMPQPTRVKRDAVAFELGPFEGLQYKYRLEKGGAMVYSWTATGEVTYDFRGEPDGARDGYAESYEQKARVTAAHGAFVAPAPGLHGWFWENQTGDVITITLTSSGFYSGATEFREDGHHPHTLTEH